MNEYMMTMVVALIIYLKIHWEFWFFHCWQQWLHNNLFLFSSSH